MKVTIINELSDQINEISVKSFDNLQDQIKEIFKIGYHKQIIKHNNTIITLFNEANFTKIKDGDFILVNKKSADELDNYFEQAQLQMINETPYYVKCDIFDNVICAMIDTGAQPNAISLILAKKLGIDHLINTSVRGTVHGVNTANMIGSINNIKLKINDVIEITTDIRVIDVEDKNLLILGLKTMSEFCEIINIRKRTITFNGYETKMLNDIEIEKYKEPINLTEESISENIRSLNDYLSLEEKQKMFGTVYKILSNIINNPNETKYKKINKSSNIFKENIEKHSNCIKLLENIGFVNQDANLVFESNDINKLSIANKLIAIYN